MSANKSSLPNPPPGPPLDPPGARGAGGGSGNDAAGNGNDASGARLFWLSAMPGGKLAPAPLPAPLLGL